MELLRFNTGGCLSYLLFCPEIREALVIDPTFPETKFIQALESRWLKLKFIVDTHTHADHASAGACLAEKTGAPYLLHEKGQEDMVIPDRIPENIKRIIENNKAIPKDGFFGDNAELKVGNILLKVYRTPGHTVDSVSLKAGHLLFTGDFLLVNQCGRTDLPGGSVDDLFASIFDFLVNLPEDTVAYPAHDYQDNINTALGYERVHNPFLKERDHSEFKRFAGSFFPPLDTEGGKLQCSITGEQHAENIYAPQGKKISPVMHDFCFHLEGFLKESSSDFNAVSSEELHRLLQTGAALTVIDVRDPQELATDGRIKGALHIPLRQLPQNTDRLPADRGNPLVTLCRSGSRSSYAALYLRALGYRIVRNLEGGILDWIRKGYPVIK